MRYVAAYCLFALSGKNPSAKDLEKLLGSVGVDCDAEQAKKVVSELEGKDLEELIKDGKSLMFSWNSSQVKTLYHLSLSSFNNATTCLLPRCYPFVLSIF